MIHRNKKKNDFHEGKWNGLGGNFEPAETALMCVTREVYEESGLTIVDPTLLGVCYFPNVDADDEWMYIYITYEFEGDLRECPEGELHWVLKERMLELNVWGSDRIFIPYVLNEHFFIGRFEYDGKRLIKSDIQVVKEATIQQFLSLTDDELEKGYEGKG